MTISGVVSWKYGVLVPHAAFGTILIGRIDYIRFENSGWLDLKKEKKWLIAR